MRSRWVDSFKRGLAPSPRGERSPLPSSGPSTRTPSSTFSTASVSSFSGAENPSFFHDSDRCECVGVCSVARVLENCVLQGGVHHTHLHVLTYLGRPLRSDWCCYPVVVQWFRAVGEMDDFQVIPGACDEWYTPTADDIGARILAKVMIEDEDVLKTKMLEYGPIKEDPEVRSKVEMYLDRKSVLFMGLRSISVQDGSEYLNEEELRESWTLLIDDRRVRLTCESSLIPPFESLYTADIKLEMVRGTPNEFYLHLAEGCYVRLRAESNTVRDIVVLTLRAFCKMAVSDDVTHEAVAQGLSPMLTLRKIAQEEEAKKPPPQTQEAPPAPPLPLSAPIYDLPWNRSPSTSFSMDQPESTGASTMPVEVDESLEGGSRRLSLSSSRRPSLVGRLGGGTGVDRWQHSDDIDDSLLMDAEALIGNAQKMGIQYQILPRAPKRISIVDIPDLQIIEAMDAVNDHVFPGSNYSRQEEEKVREQQRNERRRRESTGNNTNPEEHRGGSGNNVSGSVVAGLSELPDVSCIDKAIEDFMADESDKESFNISALRERYVVIFCALQRELQTSKQRVVALSKQLEEKQELNTSFRKDIESLRGALTSMQLADKVYDLVTTDLQQLVKRTANEAAPLSILT